MDVISVITLLVTLAGVTGIVRTLSSISATLGSISESLAWLKDLAQDHESRIRKLEDE